MSLQSERTAISPMRLSTGHTSSRIPMMMCPSAPSFVAPAGASLGAPSVGATTRTDLSPTPAYRSTPLRGTLDSTTKSITPSMTSRPLLSQRAMTPPRATIPSRPLTPTPYHYGTSASPAASMTGMKSPGPARQTSHSPQPASSRTLKAASASNANGQKSHSPQPASSRISSQKLSGNSLPSSTKMNLTVSHLRHSQSLEAHTQPMLSNVSAAFDSTPQPHQALHFQQLEPQMKYSLEVPAGPAVSSQGPYQFPALTSEIGNHIPRAANDVGLTPKLRHMVLPPNNAQGLRSTIVSNAVSTPKEVYDPKTAADADLRQALTQIAALQAENEELHGIGKEQRERQQELEEENMRLKMQLDEHRHSVSEFSGHQSRMENSLRSFSNGVIERGRAEVPKAFSAERRYELESVCVRNAEDQLQHLRSELLTVQQEAQQRAQFEAVLCKGLEEEVQMMRSRLEDVLSGEEEQRVRMLRLEGQVHIKALRAGLLNEEMQHEQMESAQPQDGQIGHSRPWPVLPDRLQLPVNDSPDASSSLFERIQRSAEKLRDCHQQLVVSDGSLCNNKIEGDPQGGSGFGGYDFDDSGLKSLHRQWVADDRG